MSDTIIQIKDVNKWFGDFQVLKNINLNVEKNKKIVVCGPSGSGKSTLIRCINRLEEHQQGSIVVDGNEFTEDTKNIEQIRAEVGMVFQQFNLFPHLSILDNCTLAPIWVKKMPKKDAEEIAMSYLEKVKIPEQAKKFPGQLSGGQQQRGALARSLITQPSVLLLDEPLSALDPFLRVKMRYELRALQQKLGITFIHVTHSQDEALALSDIIVVMNDGKIEQVDKPAEIFNRPKNEFVAKFVGNHNIVQLSGKKFAVRMDKTNFEIAKIKSSKTAIVSAIEFQGEKTKVLAVYQDQSEIQCLIGDSQFSDEKFKIGSLIRANWAREHLVPLHN